MTIINHGSWALYVPGALPKDAPPGALFCKRDADGVDWYAFIYNSGAVFSPGSIKATVRDGIVHAATRDETMLFPQAATVLEITGDDTADPQAAYGGQVYDATANTLAAPAPMSLTAYAASVRYQKETGGITVNGVPVATDRQSQAMINGAFNMANLDATFTTQWKTASGAFISLNAPAIISLAKAVGAHVAACFAMEATTDAAINAGTITTTAQVDSAFAGITT